MLLLYRIIWLFVIFQFSTGKVTRIGIVNKMWRGILETKLRERGWSSKCRFYNLMPASKMSFYTSIIKVNQQIESLKIDVIIGNSRLDVAQSAAYQNIPFIAFDNKLHVSSRPEYENMPNFYSLPVSEDVYARATFDVLRIFKVQNVAVIIDETVDYKNFIQPFFEIKTLFTKVWTISSPDLKTVMERDIEIEKILQTIRQLNLKDIVLKSSKQNLNAIIKKARFFGMLSIPQRWYLPNFVCEDFKINTMRHIFTNFTFINEHCSTQFLTSKTNFFEITLVDQFIQIIRSVKWDFKPATLSRILKGKSALTFNDEGSRNSYNLYFHTISRSKTEKIKQVGVWLKRPGSRRKFSYNASSSVNSYRTRDMPAHMRIVSVEEHPHLIVKANNTMVGFGVDLMKKLAQKLQFTFSIRKVDSYGEKVNGTWTGLVGELIYGNADMSLGPVVQTREREDILDFSTTFKQREISLVMKKPQSSPNYFQFLGPFSAYIWLLVVSSIVVLTIVLWIVEHFHDKHFPEQDRIKFNLKESSWFILASTLQGGTENVPFSVPGRILTATLYFFVIIIVTSYTANLAAFLTVKAYSNPIKSVEDLVSLPPDSNIKFGTVENSAIHDFFKHSEIGLYKKIYKIMTIVNKDWLVNSTSEGYKRATRENYVFLWDDSVNQYEINTETDYNCQLYIVGLPFGSRSFAVGMPQGAYYKERISKAILNLLESGTIENLEHTWWKSTSICTGGSEVISSNSLTVRELAGVFLVLMCGLCVSILVLCFKIFFFHCKPFESMGNCCRQFFENLSPTSRPPISPIVSNQNTITTSKINTLNRTNTTGTVTDPLILPNGPHDSLLSTLSNPTYSGAQSPSITSYQNPINNEHQHPSMPLDIKPSNHLPNTTITQQNIDQEHQIGL